MGNKGPHWTKEETAYLEEKWGKHSIENIAKKLGRSYEGVRMKAKRMGLGGAIQGSGKVTANQLAELTGVDRKTVLRWLQNGLPYKEMRLGKKVHTKLFYLIEPKDFWKWAEKWPYMDYRKIERGVLLPEPKWLDEKIRLQYKMLSKRHNTFWTTAEDALLQSLLKTNMTYKQIGERMGRTDKAIERRVGILAARAMGKEAK